MKDSFNTVRKCQLKSSISLLYLIPYGTFFTTVRSVSGLVLGDSASYKNTAEKLRLAHMHGQYV